MGTEVAVVKMNKPVAWVDPSKAVKYNAGRNVLARNVGSKSPFKGTALKFDGQKGEVLIGFGDGAKVMKEGRQLVLNLPNTLVAWQYWPDGEGSSYPYIAPMFSDEGLPPRNVVDPNNETKEYGGEEKPCYQEVTVLILRDLKTGEQYNLVCGSSVQRAVSDFILSILDEAEANPGKLPVITIGAVEESFKKGKVTVRFQKITPELIDWVKATSADGPQSLSAVDEPAAEEAEEEVEAPRTRKATASASSKPVSRRQVEEDEPEAEEVEEDAPRAVSRSAVKKPVAARKPVAQVEEPEEEEEEVSTPIRNRFSKRRVEVD